MATATVGSSSASMAQTFSVYAPAGVSGIYVRDIDLFFESVSPTFGVSLRIVGLTNGLPDMAKAVTGANCVLNAGVPVASADGSVATRFTFGQLVFLQSNTTYALVIRALGAVPDYEVWTARAGDTDLATGFTVSSNPATGNLYYAKNSGVWSEIPDEDLKYIIYRAQFDISNDAWAKFIKANTEIMHLANSSFLNGPTDIVAGDEVFGLTANMQANTLVHADVYKYDTTNELLYCKNSTGNFVEGGNIQIVRPVAQGNVAGSSLQALSTIKTLTDVQADGVVAKIGTHTDSMTSATYEYLGVVKPTGNTPVLETSYRTVPTQTEEPFLDASHFILSRSNEVSKLGSASSAQLKVDMSSPTDYLSPIINLKERALVAYTNKINSDTSGEEGDYGNALTRYIGNTVILAEGMDAETLTVWLDAFKPAGTEVYVYAKIWNAEDAMAFDSEPWSRLDQTGNVGVFSDPKNSDNYVEYSYQFPTTFSGIAGTAWQPLSGLDRQAVQYSNSNGLFSSFKGFAIKIVLAVDGTSTNLVPILNDVRAIASML